VLGGVGAGRPAAMIRRRVTARSVDQCDDDDRPSPLGNQSARVVVVVVRRDFARFRRRSPPPFLSAPPACKPTDAELCAYGSRREQRPITRCNTRGSSLASHARRHRRWQMTTPAREPYRRRRTYRIHVALETTESATELTAIKSATVQRDEYFHIIR